MSNKNNNERNNKTSDIQKLDDNDLQFSAGNTDVNNASTFFKRNRVSTTCDHCGKPRELKFSNEELTPETSHVIYGITGYFNSVDWTCEHCGGKNHTFAKRKAGLFNGFANYKSWGGWTKKC